MKALVSCDRNIRWIDQIHKADKLQPLKYMTKINSDTLPESTFPEFPLKYIDIGSVKSTGEITEFTDFIFNDAPSRARRIVEEGDTIVSTVRTYLKAIAYISNEDIKDANLIASTGFAVLSPINQILHSRYLFYWMRSKFVIDEICARSVGVSYPATNATEIGSIPIPHISIKYQEKIATFLDRKTAAIDTLITKKQRLIELLEEKRAALINQAVTKGLNPDVPMKDSGIPWIGEIPEHWEILPVKRLARPGRKTFVDGDWIELPFIEEDGIRLIQTGNVGIGKYREKGYRYISERTFRDLKCTEVEPQNVLICRLDGPVGRACLAPDLGVKMITSVDNAILKPDSVHDPRFIVYFMSSKCYLEWNQVLCRVGGGHRLRISRTMLGDLRIPMPPTSEQYNIADQIDQKTSEIEKISNLLLKQIEKLQEYRQSLITAAVTGKLEVPADEAAY